MNKTRDISFWCWLVIPLASGLFFISTIFIRQDFWKRVMPGELGIVENAQFILLIGAFYFGIRILRNPSVWPDRWFCIWITILTIGFFYIAGEEISWGQQYFFWKTTGWFHAVNSQNETNLHNVHFFKQILNMLPFRTLEAVVFWGGVVYPLLVRFAPGFKMRVSRYGWFLPSVLCFPSACAAQVVQILRTIDPVRHYMRTELPWLSISEMKEYFVYLFLFIYIGSIYYRLKQSLKQQSVVSLQETH